MKIILFLLFSFSAFSQTYTISGFVKDSTQKSVSMVNIFVKSGEGTLTNDEGGFVLRVAKLPAQIIISHISYQAVELTIKDDKLLNIILKESIKTLPEVKVGNYAFELVKKTIDKSNIDSVYNHFGRGFYRKIQTEGDKYTVLHEMFFNANINGKYGIDSWQPTASRYTNHDGNVENKYLLYQILNVRNSSPSPRVRFWGEKGEFLTVKEIPEYYHFEVENFINPDSPDEIAVVVCKPKKEYETSFSGKLYIKTVTNGILRVVGRRGSLKNVWPSNFWFKVKDSYVEMDISYREDENKASILVGMNLNFVTMVQYASAVNRKVSDDVILTIYEYDKSKDGEQSKLSANIPKEDQIFATTQESPEFWANNPIIKRTPLEDKVIKTFERRKKKGGNMFPSSR